MAISDDFTVDPTSMSITLTNVRSVTGAALYSYLIEDWGVVRMVLNHGKWTEVDTPLRELSAIVHTKED